MINHVYWALVNDPDAATRPGAAYKDPTFVTPLQLSAACSRAREFLLGTDNILDKAAAIAELMRSRRYMRYTRLLDARWVWPVMRSYKPTVAPDFLPSLRDSINEHGQRYFNDMLPLVGTYGVFENWYSFCRHSFDTAVQPFDKLAMFVSVYCHRGTFI